MPGVDQHRRHQAPKCCSGRRDAPPGATRATGSRRPSHQSRRRRARTARRGAARRATFPVSIGGERHRSRREASVKNAATSAPVPTCDMRGQVRGAQGRPRLVLGRDERRGRERHDLPREQKADHVVDDEHDAHGGDAAR